MYPNRVLRGTEGKVGWEGYGSSANQYGRKKGNVRHHSKSFAGQMTDERIDGHDVWWTRLGRDWTVLLSVPIDDNGQQGRISDSCMSRRDIQTYE